MYYCAFFECLHFEIYVSPRPVSSTSLRCHAVSCSRGIYLMSSQILFLIGPSCCFLLLGLPPTRRRSCGSTNCRSGRTSTWTLVSHCSCCKINILFVFLPLFLVLCCVPSPPQALLTPMVWRLAPSTPLAVSRTPSPPAPATRAAR